MVKKGIERSLRENSQEKKTRHSTPATNPKSVVVGEGITISRLTSLFAVITSSRMLFFVLLFSVLPTCSSGWGGRLALLQRKTEPNQPTDGQHHSKRNSTLPQKKCPFFQTTKTGDVLYSTLTRRRRHDPLRYECTYESNEDTGVLVE